MSDGDTVRADDVVEAVPHRGDEACSYDCEAPADYDVTMVRNGNEGTFPACEGCAVEHGVRPEDIAAQTPVHVGDHVEDREDPDATMLVVGLTGTKASEYTIGGAETVAEYDDNAAYPDDDQVIKVAFPQRTHNAVPTDSFAYPRSRLRVVASIHDIGEGGGGDE